jgi:DNA polymerase-1
MVREAAFRQAINMPVQGTEADLMKMAMLKLETCFVSWRSTSSDSPTLNHRMAHIRPRQILQIHDSILVECDEADAQKVGEVMKDVMENIYPSLGVRLRVDVHTGKNWGEL